MNTTSGRIFGYGRVSTSEQTTENQRHELSEAGYILPPHRWLADQGISGKTPASQRPRFGELVQKLEPGDTLVVSKLDRLGRDSMDVEATLRALEGLGVAVVVLQLGKVDLTSTAGKLIRRVLAAVAEMERDLLVERTKAGLQRAREENKQLGRPSKTTAEQQTTILERLAYGDSVSALARTYGISRATVISIRSRAMTESA